MRRDQIPIQVFMFTIGLARAELAALVAKFEANGWLANDLAAF